MVYIKRKTIEQAQGRGTPFTVIYALGLLLKNTEV